MMLITAQAIFVVNFVWSLFAGKRAADNPWEATTLEWTTATPPPARQLRGPLCRSCSAGPTSTACPAPSVTSCMQTNTDETAFER